MLFMPLYGIYGKLKRIKIIIDSNLGVSNVLVIFMNKKKTNFLINI